MPLRAHTNRPLRILHGGLIILLKIQRRLQKHIQRGPRQRTQILILLIIKLIILIRNSLKHLEILKELTLTEDMGGIYLFVLPLLVTVEKDPAFFTERLVGVGKCVV